jgi:hypothetical protein
MGRWLDSAETGGIGFNEIEFPEAVVPAGDPSGGCDHGDPIKIA